MDKVKRRKLIGVITSFPESVHAQRTLRGIFKQCDRYGYDVAVFASMINVSNFYKEYLSGEANIYNLINFDQLDGVIIDGATLTEGGEGYYAECIRQKMERECTKPVIVMNEPVGNYEFVQSDDTDIFKDIVAHVVDVHGITDIYFLTGIKGHPISEGRLRVCIEGMQARGYSVSQEQIFYGDFWYTSGTALAERMLSGEIRIPKAVICACDYMALGLMNRLAEGGVRIPEDLIVVGFEATLEAALHEIPLTSYESNMTKSAADVVDLLRQKIEPGAEIVPYEMSTVRRMHTGVSCGCLPDMLHSARAFRESFYFTSRDYGKKDFLNHIDIGLLMEGYLAERFSGTEAPEECLHLIYENTYYLLPYSRFFLCLKENWLDIEQENVCGYPKRMQTVVHTVPELGSGFYGTDKAEKFDTALMLPQLYDEHEPSVFYFSAVHFREKMFGYAVLQRSLKEKCMANLVYRNWLRDVNNALEMIRAKNRLVALSVRDGMTGAYNRRGMELMLSKMRGNAKEGDSLFVGIVDMDGLKYINDTFGHTEGDAGIRRISAAMKTIMRNSEICVRAGGDEFYIMGIGRYDECDKDARILAFQAAMEKENQKMEKPYLLSASMGCAIAPVNEALKVDCVIDEADEVMYRNKVARKRQRS